MKTNPKLALLIVIHLFISLPALAQDKKEVVTKSLFKAGDRKQLMADSTIKGSIEYRDAKLASINKCSFIIQLENDVISSYRVSTFNKRNSKKLVAEAFKAYGQPTITLTENNAETYQWKYSADGRNAETIIHIERGKGDLTSSYK
jgi:hypothetical protein